MNDIDPQAWLADALARVPDHPVQSRQSAFVALEGQPPEKQRRRRVNAPLREPHLSGVLAGCVPSVNGHAERSRPWR